MKHLKTWNQLNELHSDTYESARKKAIEQNREEQAESFKDKILEISGFNEYLQYSENLVKYISDPSRIRVKKYLNSDTPVFYIEILEDGLIANDYRIYLDIRDNRVYFDNTKTYNTAGHITTKLENLEQFKSILKHKLQEDNIELSDNINELHSDTYESARDKLFGNSDVDFKNRTLKNFKDKILNYSNIIKNDSEFYKQFLIDVMINESLNNKKIDDILLVLKTLKSEVLFDLLNDDDQETTDINDRQDILSLLEMSLGDDIFYGDYTTTEGALMNVDINILEKILGLYQ